MRVFKVAAFMLVVSVFTPCPSPAQPVEQFEAGVLVSAVRLDAVDVTDPGIGGRFAWNVSRAAALEAAADFYPAGKFDVVRGGRKAVVLAGPKLTWRSERIGLFAKARTGIARVGEGRAAGACIAAAVFPPPEGCYNAETRLAFDVGGGVEIYPSSRTSVRFDIGALITRLGDRSQRFGRNDGYARDLQVAAGVGLRF
jgi:hypothetical protein